MANVLSLHERCSSEQEQKDIKAAKDQKSVVGRLKEDRIAEHLRSRHGGLVDGWMGGLTVVKGTRNGRGHKYSRNSSRDPNTI